MRRVGLAFPVGLWAVVAACSSTAGNGAPARSDPPPSVVAPAQDAAPADPAAAADAGPYFPLGMNDVTILVPLPASLASPVVLRASDPSEQGHVLARGAFDGLMVWVTPIPVAYERLHIVGVRFDLCDRSTPGPCGGGADGRMRLVFQPVLDGAGGAEDIGVHVFYSIPAAEIPAAIGALRALARKQSTPYESPLQPSPALSASNEPYASDLRAFVRRYARDQHIVRVTINALDSPHLASTGRIRWLMNGIEGRDATPTVVVPGTAGANGQGVQFSGNASYVAGPSSDLPAGLNDVLLQSTFDAASDTEKGRLLDALATADNPLLSAPSNVPCVACHVSTVVTAARAATSNIDPTTLPSRYASSHDLSVGAGGSTVTDRTLRAFGWLGTQPMISQRVVNETAQVVDEIEARFH